MVQRILMLALVLLAFTMPTEAITLQELKTSPQFKLVHVQAMNGPMESGGLYIYLNTYSIEAGLIMHPTVFFAWDLLL